MGQLEDISEFLKAIDSGRFDDSLIVLEKEIEKRKDHLKESVRQRVKEIFGENADVVIRDEMQPMTPPEVKNPFVSRALEGKVVAATEPETEIETDEPTPDPLSNLDSIEQQMEETGGVERRGSSVGGLHPADIA